MSRPQLLWNFRVNPEERNVRYVFAIINEPREAEAIRNRIISTFAPVDTEMLLERKRKVAQGHYHIMALTTQKKLENLNEISRGNVKRDERLYERQTTGIDGLEAYVVSLLR
ncbi:MAG: hypothetical protein Q8L29_01430 [archaeon]|nr:hypothetical protein [archaeon]